MSLSDVLHVYGQHCPHDDVWISGDRCALLALRDCIDSALERGADQSDNFTADGEGYTVKVRCELPDVIMGYSLPYSDEEGGNGRRNFPWTKEIPVLSTDI